LKTLKRIAHRKCDQVGRAGLLFVIREQLFKPTSASWAALIFIICKKWCFFREFYGMRNCKVTEVALTTRLDADWMV
jgi:hypothetical protein